MTEITQPIPARLRNVAVNGHVAGAADIIDDSLNKTQDEINQQIAEMEDKPYDPTEFSGMGRKVLPKNIQTVGGVEKNVLTQAMMPIATGQNTIYVIQYDYVLGEDITVPENCVLEFDGGSLTDNSLTGNNTFIDINQSTPVFNNIKMLGSFHAKEFPLNLYNTTKIDYLYTLLQSFSGTNFVLNDDYSVTETDSTVDGTTPHTLNLDGNGYKLTLHSFGAYNMTKCSIKNITIEAQNNSVGSWHVDDFKFGVLGYSETSTLDVYNVTFTSNVGRLYMRSFKSINISNCLEDGVYFYVASTHCVTVKDCRVIDATGGYHQINDSFTPDDEDFTIIDNCFFENLSSFGIVLTGGVKINPTITNCKLVNVGSGSAERACINMHPKGVVTINNNYIVANVGAAPLDIDSGNPLYFDKSTVVFVENNVIKNTSNDSTIHGIALFGLRRLYLRNNNITDQTLNFTSTVDIECADNTFNFTNVFVNSYDLVLVITSADRINDIHNHYFKRNIFNLRKAGFVHITYRTTTLKANIYGIGNIWNGIDFVVNSDTANCFGDIYRYNFAFAKTKQIREENSYLTADKTDEKFPIGLKRYDAKINSEIRGSFLGQVDNNLNPPGTVYIGNTASRPKLCLPGTAYFDTTLNKVIYAQGTKAKLAVQITGGLTSPDGSLVSDECVAYMKNMTICCYRQTTTEIPAITILEYFGRINYDYQYYQNIGLLERTGNFQNLTVTLTCIYVGEIGDDYGVVHSNTVNGFTTSHNLVNDGSITWVDALGNPVGTDYQTGITGVAGNLAGFDTNGKLADSGSKPSDFEPASA